MPAVSRQQWLYMKSVAEGRIKDSSLSREQAKEYISSQPSPKNLPKRKKKKT